MKDSMSLALRLAELAFERKAINLKILDVRTVVDYADYVIVCSCKSDRQAQSIAEHVVTTVKHDLGLRPLGVEGQDDGQWVLVDYGSVVMHVFNGNRRDLYDLDGLFADAERVPVTVPEWAGTESEDEVDDYGYSVL